jgi:DNA-binding PadR family transcriptional regulator
VTSALGEFEQLVLLALLRLGPEAYGATVREEIEDRSRRRVSISAVYTTLDRLEQKGLVRSWVGGPTPQRGGRRRRHFDLSLRGARALRHAHQAYAAMIAGFEHRLKTP